MGKDVKSRPGIQRRKGTNLTCKRFRYLDSTNRRKKHFEDDLGPRPGRKGETPSQAEYSRQRKVHRAELSLANAPQYVQDAIHDIQHEVGLDLGALPRSAPAVKESEAGTSFDVCEEEEEEDLLCSIRDQIRSLSIGDQRAVITDYRSYEAHLQQSYANWDSISELCARVFLQWRNGICVECPNQGESNRPPEEFWEKNYPSERVVVFHTSTLGMTGFSKKTAFWAISPLQNFSLLRQGFVGCSAVKPTLAICLRSIEDYVALRRQCPSLSIERFTKAMCARSKILYTPSIRRKVSRAVDYFMEMEKIIDHSVDKHFGLYNLEDHLCSACPACHHKVKDEPVLQYSIILAMDGNESQRRNASNATDPRRFNSNFYLTQEYVDQFKDEAKSRKTKHDSDATVETHQKGDSKNCTRNWTAAKPDSEKQMFSTYDETGIFVLTCRHGSVLLIADMIRSGELSKYPLAMVAKALEVFGDNVFIAYDIGCSFSATVRNSSLGPIVRTKGLRFGTPAWHGWSHNRQCQLDYHPLFTIGLGLEDAEGCERVFSRTNGCARAIRYSSKYHRKQAIDLTVSQWNVEKHHNLGLFIYNNYKQALEILRHNERSLARLEELTSITRAQFAGFIEEEKAYLRSLEKEVPKETIEMEYIDLLQKLKETERRVLEAKKRLDACPISKKSQRTTLSRAWRDAQEVNLKWEQHIKQFECAENIEKRWTDNDKEWVTALKHLQTRRYRRALDELSRLLIQRLFELEKMGIGGCAYKLRKSLAKALRRRSAALKTALEKFNTEAANLKRPQLEFQQLLSYSFIADLALLRDSREDIRNQPWTQPSVRQGIASWLKMERAKEEIRRLDVEAARLRSWIKESALSRNDVVARLKTSDPHLAMEIKRRDLIQRAYDEQNLKYLSRVDRLAFRAENAAVSMMAMDDQVEMEIDVLDEGQEELEEVESLADEEEADDLEKFENFLQSESHLPVLNDNPVDSDIQ